MTLSLPEKKTFTLYVYRDLVQYLLATGVVTRAEMDEFWQFITDSPFGDEQHVHLPMGYWGWRCPKCKSTRCDHRGERLHTDPFCDCEEEEQTPPDCDREGPGFNPESRDGKRDLAAFKVMKALEQFSDKMGDLVVFMEIS